MEAAGPCVRVCCEAGDAYVIDSRVLHRGAANTTRDTDRVLLYLSFMRAEGADEETGAGERTRYTGSTRTLRADYEGKYSLAQLVSMCGKG